MDKKNEKCINRYKQFFYYTINYIFLELFFPNFFRIMRFEVFLKQII